MGCGSCMEGIMRIILIILNIITLIAGGVLLGCGVYVLISFNPFKTDSTADVNTYLIGLYVIIGLGAFVVLVSLMGCLGACLQSNGLLSLYFFLVLVLLLAEIGMGILVAVEKDEIEKQIDATFSEFLNEYGSDAAGDAYINAIQDALNCCGYNGPQDYLNFKHITNPPDCWKKLEMTGCKQRIEEVVKDNSTTAIIGVAAVGVLEIITMLMACYIRKRQLSDINDSPPYTL